MPCGQLISFFMLGNSKKVSLLENKYAMRIYIIYLYATRT